MFDEVRKRKRERKEKKRNVVRESICQYTISKLNSTSIQISLSLDDFSHLAAKQTRRIIVNTDLLNSLQTCTHTIKCQKKVDGNKKYFFFLLSNS
jgi:hypothetical protein